MRPICTSDSGLYSDFKRVKGDLSTRVGQTSFILYVSSQSDFSVLPPSETPSGGAKVVLLPLQILGHDPLSTHTPPKEQAFIAQYSQEGGGEWGEVLVHNIFYVLFFKELYSA